MTHSGGTSWERLQVVGKRWTSESLSSPPCGLGVMCDQGRTIATKQMSVVIKHGRYVLKGKGTEGKLSKTFQCTGFPAFSKLFKWKWTFSERYPERNFLPWFSPSDALQRCPTGTHLLNSWKPGCPPKGVPAERVSSRTASLLSQNLSLTRRWFKLASWANSFQSTSDKYLLPAKLQFSPELVWAAAL